MKIKDLHRWDITPEEARALQIELAGSVMGGVLPEVTTVLGLDVSYRRSTGRVRASAVLLSNPDMAQTLSLSHEGLTPFPYVPGLLSFREVPALLPLLRECPPPSLIMVDGQGIAHPRGLGLASHVGLLTGIPTIGCAKSRLIGEHEELADEPGADRPLMINGKLSGYILRSKSRCNPLYVSPGHLLDPDEALKGVRICLRGYRLPEPIRLADRLSKQRDTVVSSQESGVRSQESGVRSQESEKILAYHGVRGGTQKVNSVLWIHFQIPE